MKITARVGVLLASCCMAVQVFQPEDNSTEYLHAVSPYNAFCPSRCPDLVALPEDAQDLANFLQSLQKTNPETPLTIRGGGHSYSCQSTSSTGVVIDMKRFRHVAIKEPYQGKKEVEVGAGLRMGELSAVIEPYGWSVPHGQCKTVGVAGWMLNRGSHPLLQNYQRSYGPGSFLREIQAVTVRGSIVHFTKDDVNVKQLSPFEPHIELQRAIDTLKASSKRSKENPDGYLLPFRWYGANFLIATQFTIEIREAKVPLFIRVGYNISRMDSLVPNLHKVLLGPDEFIKCLAWPHLHMKAKTIGAPPSYPSTLEDPERLYLQCVDWSPSASAESTIEAVAGLLGEKPDMSMVDTAAFERMASHEGFGWYPAFFEAFWKNKTHPAKLIKFIADELAKSDCRINAGMGLHVRPGWQGHPFGFKYQDYGLTKEDELNGGWIGYDVWFGDEQDRKEECIASARKFMARFGEVSDSLGLIRRPIDVHLPDCSIEEDGPANWTDKSWQSQYYQREPYGHLMIMKQMWDPQHQISFFLGIAGEKRNPKTCAGQFAKRTDLNCKKAGITERDNMMHTRRYLNDICSVSKGCCFVNSKNFSSCERIPPAAHTVHRTWFPVSSLSMWDFKSFVSWSMVFFIMLVGAILEFVVSKALPIINPSGRSLEWLVGLPPQLAFLGLACVVLWGLRTGDSITMLLVPCALWKFGIPEIIIYFKLSISDPQRFLRALNFLYGSGVLFHHLASVIAFVFNFSGVIRTDQPQVIMILCAMGIHASMAIMDFHPILWYIGVVSALAIEMVLQINCWSYFSHAEWPLNLTCLLLSLSHVIFWVSPLVFLLKYKRLPKYFLCYPPEHAHQTIQRLLMTTEEAPEEVAAEPGAITPVRSSSGRRESNPVVQRQAGIQSGRPAAGGNPIRLSSGPGNPIRRRPLTAMSAMSC